MSMDAKSLQRLASDADEKNDHRLHAFAEPLVLRALCYVHDGWVITSLSEMHRKPKCLPVESVASIVVKLQPFEGQQPTR